MAVGIAGLFLLAGGAFFLTEGAYETSATVGGSLALIGAHIVNWRLRRSATCCGDQGCPAECD